MLYRGMDRAQLDTAYNNSAAVTNYNAIKADWHARSARVRQSRRGHLDLEYGDTPRQHLDPFLTDSPRGWGHEEYLLPASNFPLGILQISKSLAFYQGHHNEAIGWEEGRNRVMTTNNHIDRELGEAQLDEQDLDQVTGGVIITKHVDKASPSLMLSGGGTPSLEYWLQQLMF
jgi:hypothetical protein